MNGLFSDQPSPAALRLAVGGYVLSFAETFLLLLTPERMGDLRPAVWTVTFVSGASLIGALCGLPRPENLGDDHDH
jgi:hypothetical protein